MPRLSPVFIEPMTAKVVDALPEGDRWIYEVKFDGYRALLLKDGGQVRLRSRKENDLTATYPAVAAAGMRLNAETAVLDGEIVALDATGRPSFDGEIVALDATGRPSFQALQHRSAHPGYAIVFYAFDLLHLNGENLTGLALTERTTRLRDVVAGSGVLLSEPLQGTAAQVIQAVSQLGLEGIVAKRTDSRYDAGQRGGAWVKLKLDKQQEFVVGGYRPGTHGVDALLVGYHDVGGLRFAGKVRAGFTPHLRRDVFELVKPLHATACPFVDLPNSKASHWGGGVTNEQMAEMQWTRPRLVAQIRFVEWTSDGHLRHAAFLGIRTDKTAKDVRRET
jgi:bifunctional non-homologous end joining protein LigD